MGLGAEPEQYLAVLVRPAQLPQIADGHGPHEPVLVLRLAQQDLLSAMQHTRNGRRLLAIPELRDDVAFCVQRETLSFVAGLLSDGTVRRMS